VKVGGIVRRRAVIEAPVLSLRYGGGVRLKSYCLYFQERPSSLRSSICVGCSDRERCTDNRPSASRETLPDAG